RRGRGGGGRRADDRRSRRLAELRPRPRARLHHLEGVVGRRGRVERPALARDEVLEALVTHDQTGRRPHRDPPPSGSIFQSPMMTNQAPPGVRWKLQLVGRNEELRALAKMFAPLVTGAGLSVWLEDERCYLHAPEFEGMSDTTAVLARGEVLVGRLNGLGFLKFGAFRPVETGNIMQ